MADIVKEEESRRDKIFARGIDESTGKHICVQCSNLLDPGTAPQYLFLRRGGGALSRTTYRGTGGDVPTVCCPECIDQIAKAKVDKIYSISTSNGGGGGGGCSACGCGADVAARPADAAQTSPPGAESPPGAGADTAGPAGRAGASGAGGGALRLAEGPGPAGRPARDAGRDAAGRSGSVALSLGPSAVSHPSRRPPPPTPHTPHRSTQMTWL
ncbi:hypothetical protein THAOC_11850, partial [Thalassiosira oceanica]